MERHDRIMTLGDYTRALGRRRWIVVAAAIAAVVGSLAMSMLTTPVYEAEAQMLVEPRSGELVFQQDPALNVPNLERAIQTEIRVLEGQLVRRRVQQDLGLPGLPPEVSGQALGATDVVSVSVRSEIPEVARVLADAYVAAYGATRRDQAVAGLVSAADELQATVDEVQDQIDAIDEQSASGPIVDDRSLSEPLVAERLSLIEEQAGYRERRGQLRIDAALTTGGASIVKAAELPESPSAPQPVRDGALALTLGLLLGILAAIVVDRLDDSLRNEEDLALLTDLPVLAVVPTERPPDRRPIAISEPQELAVEAYRGLRTNIQFLGLDRSMRIIMITSSVSGEGKTTTAANLAVVLARAGRRVMLVDADLRKPQVHELFAVAQSPGLTEVLLGESVAMVANAADGGVDVVTAGTAPANPSELLASERLRHALRELADSYDYVIVDTAPILPVADSIAISRAADGVVLVAQANRVSRRHVSDALGRLGRVDANLFGIVLNRARVSGGYGYRYRYQTAGEEDRDSVAFTDRGEADTVTAPG